MDTTLAPRLRNADLATLADMLRNQNAHKNDVVAPATSLHMEDGILVVKNAETIVSMDGVTTVSARYTPTDIFNEGVATKLNIPNGYLRRMFTERPDLYDANINGWLHGDNTGVGPDERSFLIRAFSDGQGSGVARAFLSDKFKRIDNFDVVLSALEGVKQSGLDPEQLEIKADLTDRGMRVTLRAPQISAAAPLLLENYRYNGRTGKDNPLIDAGIVIKNSETGSGAFSIAPHLTVQVCSNGMTRTMDAQRQVHLGSRLEDGIVKWSDETQQKELELVRLKTADAIKSFLDVDYLTAAIADMEKKSGKPLEGPVDKVVRSLSKSLSFSDEVADTILGEFIRGGDITAGGFAHAVTAAAHSQEDPEVAISLEESAFAALDAAYALR